MGDLAPDDETILAILRSLRMIEYEKRKRRGFRLRFTDLKYHVDRCERVLRDRGVPMHFKEISSEIRGWLPLAWEELFLSTSPPL